MGELFKHFQGWDVQAIRKEAREEARKEVREEIKEEVREELKVEVKEEVKEEVRKELKVEVQKEMQKEVWEEGIQKFLGAVKKCGIIRKDAAAHLMEEYQLSADEAEEKLKLYW